MNHRIQTAFQKNKIFAGYLTVGDGNSVAIANALIEGGVNLLELGVPFSDPIADGPVIQRAAERALKNNTTLLAVIAVAQHIRKTSEIPLVLFSYFNPLLHANPSHWLPLAKHAGIDGILVVDLPDEEGHAFYQQCLTHDILPISVVTPATSPARLKKITRHAKGFLYYASRKGTTGIRAGLPDDFQENIAMIKSISALPVLAGFGIANKTDAQKILQYADGFVVGSFFMKAVEEGVSLKELTQLAKNFIAHV
jgi:tryptophan synthase alpha chain